MNLKLLICFFTLLLVSCGSQKKVRTSSTKNPVKKMVTKKKISKEEQEKLEANSFEVVTFQNVQEYIYCFKDIANTI